MRIIETKVYTIEEHPNREKCYEYIRNNWHNLNDHSLQEFIESLKALQNIIGGRLDYSISTLPCRGEYISLTGYDKESLNELDANELPLTGVCWDFDIIKAAQEGHINSAMSALHKDTEYLYSEQGLFDLLLNNEYEFDEEGNCI